MKKSWTKILFINLLTVIAVLLVIEAVSRVVLHKIYNRAFDHSLIIDNKYSTTAGMQASFKTMVWGREFNTDSNGWRIVKAQHTGKKKWLFIGDSVTEGVGVDDTSTFASLCSEKFEEQNIENCSLIGYSALDYLHVLRSILQTDSSVELVTLFYCLNDVYAPTRTKDLPTLSRPGILGRVNGFLQGRYATYTLIKLWFYQNSDRYFAYDSRFYKKDDERFQNAMGLLDLCNSECKSKNVYFNVVILPYKSQLKDKNYTTQQMVKAFCQKDSINFSDPSEYLSKQPDINSLYLFADEIHFSEKGHRAMADFLSE